MLLQNFFNTGVAEAKSEPKGTDEKFNSPLISTDDSSKKEFNNALRDSINTNKNNKEIHSDRAHNSSDIEGSISNDGNNKSFIQLQQQQAKSNEQANEYNHAESTKHATPELTTILATAAQNKQNGNSLPEKGMQISVDKAESKPVQDGIHTPKLSESELKAQTEILANQQNTKSSIGQGQQMESIQDKVQQSTVLETKAQQAGSQVNLQNINQATTNEKSVSDDMSHKVAEIASKNKSTIEQTSNIVADVRPESKEVKGANNHLNNQQTQINIQGSETAEQLTKKKATESIVKVDTVIVNDSKAQVVNNQANPSNQVASELNNDALKTQYVPQGIVKPESASKSSNDKNSTSKTGSDGAFTSTIKLDGTMKAPDLSQLADPKFEQAVKKASPELNSKITDKAFVENKIDAKPELKRDLELQKPSKSAITADAIKTRLSSMSPTATAHLASVATQNTQSLVYNSVPGQSVLYSATDPVTSQSTSSVMAKDAALPVSVPRNQWNQRFAERISMLTLKGNSHARIRLDPPELGPMTVRILHQGGDTQIQFTVNNPIARDLVDSGTQRLKEMLEEHGFSSVNVDVNEYRRDQAHEQQEHDDLDDFDIEHLSQGSTDTIDSSKPIESYQDSIGIIDIFA